MNGICKHCLRPIKRLHGNGTWLLKGKTGPLPVLRSCDRNPAKSKQHEDVLDGSVNEKQLRIATGEVTLRIWPETPTSDLWFASEPELEEIGEIEGVSAYGSSFGGTGIEITADSLEELPVVLSRVSIAVLDIVKKYDQWADNDRMPPAEEDEPEE